MYWVTHNSFSILQALILRLQVFKKWANIPDPLPRDPNEPERKAMSFSQIVKDTKDAFDDVKQQAIDRTEAQAEQKQAQTRQQAWASEDAAYEKRRKQAVQIIRDQQKVAFDTTAPVDQQAVLEETVTQVDGATATTQRTLVKMTPAQAAEEARRMRVIDARKRREQHRQRRSRL